MAGTHPVIAAGLNTFTVPSTMPPASMPYGRAPPSTPAVPHVMLWKRSGSWIEPRTSISPLAEPKSRLKISSEAEASNESLIAPATVPAAMYEAVSCVGPQATVAPRRMYEIRSFMTRCD